MTTTYKLGLPDAARQVGVSLGTLRRAIRAGKIPAPADLSATAVVSPEWLATLKATAAASPKVLARPATGKVPPFARYEGTSAWTKYRGRVRAYAQYKASLKSA